MTSLNDKYKARPETPEYEEMCMADFAATCRIVYGQQTKGKDVLPLLNEMGFVQRRKNDKPAIIRFHRCSQEKNPEQYYGRLLKLYLPHRSDNELKTPSLPTYQAFYGAGCVHLPGTDRLEYVQHIVKRNREKYEKNSEEIESAVEEYEQNRGVIDEWCNLAPESDLVRLPLVEQERERDNENEQEDVPDYSRQADASTEVRAIREPPAIDPTLLRQMFQNLNKKQACIFYAVRDWCIKRVCSLNPEQFFFYINGGAGTGKSHLIKCIYSEASKILSKVPRYADDVDISKPTVLLTAFTGTAAFNISGTTLHSLLKLPRSLKPPIQGLGNQLDEVRSELLNAEIIVIDEVSMVSRHLFAYVDARLKQIKGTRRPFGGMSVIAVGDFYQLPPVRQSKPLCVHDPSEIDLWREHFQMITLTEIMRQKDDVVFAEMLNRIRVKGKLDVLCEADRNLLSQAITEPALCPTDALHIFATNKEVDAHNSATLALLHTHIIDIHADDYRKDPRTGRMALQDRPLKGGKNELPDTLKVAEGARVMLTRNIDIQNGLVNGAFGKLLRVVYSENDQHIIKLGLKMDNETSGKNNRTPADDMVYIERAEENLKQKGVVRRQFPVKLAFACTIHKVQGMTTTSAVVSLKSIFEPGMAYVAVSRVTSLSGLYLLDMEEKKIFTNPEITAALENMRQANLDDMMPLLHVIQTLSRSEVFTIVHHNTEGLPAHINDIKNHHELCLADVLCLTETHLRGSFVAESLHLENYNLFKRNRHLSYTNFPQMANRSGGGVAVYVKSDFQVHEKQYIHNVTDLEFLALKVEAPVSALIAVVYRPPDYTLRPFLKNLS
ncbi:ATP-dependent DNA helicase PIF1 isoform X3 [Oreochromis niloticus]|uniref:ATP-dependent DNA helicase PIF1 isoform X3 n=1 Tax=Oreochromis niloticus TaxID=8128 RepID=UPI0009047B4D|nr:ATP-dependent DNA helicase PIF1-like isoform X3 [Oreochromis niloticus]